MLRASRSRMKNFDWRKFLLKVLPRVSAFGLGGIAVIGFLFDIQPEILADTKAFFESNIVNYLWENRYLIAFVFFALLLLSIYSSKKALNEVEYLKKRSSEIRSQIDETLCVIIRDLQKLEKLEGKENISSNIENIYEKTVNVGNKIAKLFDIQTQTSHTEPECHFCVKVFSETEGNVYVKLRDSRNGSRRREGDENYHYLKNTAFKEILNRNEICFFSNDLIKLDSKSHYENANGDWKDKYNATVVVPIMKDGAGGESPDLSNVWGFICIDSKVGKFDKEDSIYILRGYGHHMKFIFDELEKYRATSTLTLLQNQSN